MSNAPIPFKPRPSDKAGKARASQKPAHQGGPGMVIPMKGIQMGAVFEMMAIVDDIKKTPIEKRGGPWKRKTPS